MKDVLQSAQALLDGDRMDSYGDPVDTADKVSAMWSVILRHKVTPGDYALMMTALKVVRQSKRPDRDNVVDAAAYLRIHEMVKARDIERLASLVESKPRNGNNSTDQTSTIGQI